MIDILPLVGSVITIGLGLLGFLLPNVAASMVGIKATSGLARSEVRATYGGLFIGLGVSCLWFQSFEMFIVVGIAWCLAAIARFIAIFIENETSPKNIGGIVLEGGVGVLFLSSAL
ncbi:MULTISPECIES: DUF4345 family protein [unclassified Pseudoalteromonas]|uniref:DUF4345 family protein n=1 Tax=unclassified Pseudoalteromonas TaxID=194690 RepID=UPI00148688EB|nr:MULTISPECIES: DUF4345 family protein [unclassified Pseudoalteromonas]